MYVLDAQVSVAYASVVLCLLSLTDVQSSYVTKLRSNPTKVVVSSLFPPEAIVLKKWPLFMPGMNIEASEKGPMREENSESGPAVEGGRFPPVFGPSTLLMLFLRTV